MTRLTLLLLSTAILAGCDGVPTGKLSPCHGQFRAEGKYFTRGVTADGTPVVLSTKSTTLGCAG